MDKPDFDKRVRAILAEESTQPIAWWWLSFCDPSKPAGEQFLGACLVQGRGFAHALRRTNDLGINPHGEVMGYGPFDAAPPHTPHDRLLSKAEIEETKRAAERNGDG